MPFTDAEVRQWREEKRLREQRPPMLRPEPVATCFLCHRPFGRGEGHITEIWCICDACDGE